LTFVILFFTKFYSTGEENGNGIASPGLKNDIQGSLVVFAASANALLLLLCRWKSPTPKAATVTESDKDNKGQNENVDWSEWTESSAEKADYEESLTKESIHGKSDVSQTSSNSMGTLSFSSSIEVRII